jgi:hypothetical protein
MATKATPERMLVLAGGPKEKHWRGRVEGQTLVQTTWAAGGKPRETVRALTSEAHAAAEFGRLQRKRMADGYVFRRDPAEAGPGEVILEAYGPVLHDLSPDGRTLALAWYGDGAVRCRIIVVDVATGARRVVHQEPGGAHKAYLHAALFDHTGEGLFCQMDSDTWRLDLGSGKRDKVAGYREFRTASYNSYVVRPTQDAARRRLVVFDAGDVVRVLEGGKAVLEVSTASKTVVCHAGGISSSGRLLALYRVSRGIAYSHPDARDDTTNEVEVWDVDRGKLRSRLPFAVKLDRVGFDPKDKQLVVSHDCTGPVAYALSSGKEVWRIGAAAGIVRPVYHFGWAFSPDGRLLAVGGNGLFLYEAASRKPIPLPDPGGYKVERVRFSGDGRLLASDRSLDVVVRKVV